MAHYLIGDVQGCDAALGRLLDTVDYSPSRDTLWLMGDLVNRGPSSAAVLRRLMGYADAARCLLGNHDLHLLAVSLGVRRAHRGDTVDDVLEAPDRAALLDWVRRQPLALGARLEGHDFLMVHAGVLPQWSTAQTLALAAEVQDVLAGPDWIGFIHQMYGNEPSAWRDDLRGDDRLRVIVNALTRLRFCTPEGAMEFNAKEGLDTAPPGYLPWFEVPGRRTASEDVTIAFGHWSTLGLAEPQNVLRRVRLWALDSGCIWGGQLSALRVMPGATAHVLVQEDCEPVRKPF
ncbi:symmetrical bis(5'-nucleosyl)-tetraphosphatase [Hylemonella gracilis]|uniref:bis(5'-nucleosyl)-tetraphosphatase (symmetrical) n=1 Tax=Hylemonella gracilis ATCC 19624 TaxID=887062 RepID=F3KSR9_9BURK|nr:symmetrical bis(5'-nucleosyl)-tetraphosphatase [Hylemonella gracilis]EGI77138.1 diadenosine tetraphosphatase [Hylemonella gracilis ATCC 19624]